MEKLKLQSKNRDLAADKPEKLRTAGRLPAELYGHKIANVHLSVDRIEFEKILRKAGESTIIELVTEDGKSHNVLIHGIQRNYLSHQPDHVDFYEVSMTEKLTATVALEFVGESSAVKTQGGVLVKIVTEVQVSCLPADLPHNIQVDISKLQNFSDLIQVKDLVVAPAVTIVTAADEAVAKVQPPRNVEAELAEPVVEDISKVEGAAEDKPEAAEGGEGEAKDGDKK